MATYAQHCCLSEAGSMRKYSLKETLKEQASLFFNEGKSFSQLFPLLVATGMIYFLDRTPRL